MNHSSLAEHIKAQIEVAEQLLPLHPQTARLSLLMNILKGNKVEIPGKAEIEQQLATILEFHKFQRLDQSNERTLSQGSSHARVLPTRGCVVTNLTLKGTPIFYHDKLATADMTTSLRGSFRMFPYAGPAPESEGDDYKLQHGYGRSVERKPLMDDWNNAADTPIPRTQGFKIDNDEIKEQETNGTLLSDSLYVEQNIIIPEENGATAHFTLHVKNEGNIGLPCAPGYHAYYRTPLKTKKDVRIGGSLIEDSIITNYLLTGVKENGGKTERVLKCVNSGKPLIVYLPQVGTVKVTLCKEFTHVRIRTEVDKPFICIEPVARGNSSDPLPIINPGEEKKYSFSIELIAKAS